VGLCRDVTVGSSGCCERETAECRLFGSPERLGRKEVKLGVHRPAPHRTTYLNDIVLDYME
jgi:hypothetical protein